MKSYAKINIFLKITGFRANYHEICSRFVLFNELFDEIDFIPRTSEELILDNKFSDNIIFKAYKELEKLGFKNELREYFSSRQIRLIKNIPSGGGLGGGSSNAAVFLLLANSELNLGIKREKLYQISQNIGADVAFFLSSDRAANVSGIGEVVCEFDDDIPPLELLLSPISCSTPEVFSRYRRDFTSFSPMPELSSLKTAEILQRYKNSELNDLLSPCLALYSDLKIKDGEFLSGSGSTKFRIKV